ncbi:hypothetical protein K492DRAFT_171180 [Lichtheimia hyalospora FSU 10163]|nr:hypothetical protein K492DRAFT_171180 [Lichtheimia hyalospora FSU 10163]
MLPRVLLLCLAVFTTWWCLFRGIPDDAAKCGPDGCIPSSPSRTPTRRNGYFLHITDTHMDENYVAGASVGTACHRKARPEDEERMKQVGYLGAPGKRCDAPIELTRQTLEWIAREWKDKLDFVIWTGDNSRHDWDRKDLRNRNQVLQLNKIAADMMTDVFGDTDITVIPCLGNNDVYPHNRPVDHDSIYNFYQQIWNKWIPPSQRPAFQKGGYFATDTASYRVLSLNSMYFLKRNKRVKNCRKSGPARDHLIWFQQELQRARDDKTQVVIIGHVPPSPRDYRKTCFREYLRISSEYKDIITSQHYGHLNMDHFLLYDADHLDVIQEYDMQQDQHMITNSPIRITRNIERYVDWLRDLYLSMGLEENPSSSSIYQDMPAPSNNVDHDYDDILDSLVAVQVSPSVLPVYYPSIRIYRYNASASAPTPTLLGYDQYYANITRWELEHPGEPLEYAIEYTTESDYGLKDLSSQSLFKLAKHMIEQDDAMWNQYTRNMFVRTQNETFPGYDEDDDDDDDDGVNAL